MELPAAVEKQVRRVTRWARVEVFLAGALLIAPAAMWFFDAWGDPPRASISAYYNMTTAAAFYVPLTIVAMLYVVNGLVKDEHIYNTALGLALFGLILFDHDGSTSGLHGVFTFIFFFGNAVVVPLFSEIAWPRFKIVLWAGIAIVVVLWQFDVVSTYVAEWLSMAFIAGHFILDQWPTKKYRAMRRGENPRIPIGARGRGSVATPAAPS